MNNKLFFILFIASIILMIRYLLFYFYAPNIQDPQQISFSTTLLSEPTTGNGYNRITVFYGNIFGAQRVSITYSQNTKLVYGQTIQIIGTIEKRVLKNKNTIISMYFPTIEAEKKTD